MMIASKTYSQHRSRADGRLPELRKIIASLHSTSPAPLLQSAELRLWKPSAKINNWGEQPERRIYFAPGVMRGEAPLSWSGA